MCIRDRDKEAYENYKNSTKGKTLNEEEYKQYETKLKALDKTKIDEKLENKLIDELNSFISNLDIYL